VTTLLVCFSCLGFVFILKYGTILAWFRAFLSKLKFFEELFKCSLCLGFWVGLAHSIFFYYTQWNNLYYLLPFMSSGFCWLFDSLVSYLQTAELLMDKKLEEK